MVSSYWKNNDRILYEYSSCMEHLGQYTEDFQFAIKLKENDSQLSKYLLNNNKWEKYLGYLKRIIGKTRFDWKVVPNKKIYLEANNSILHIKELEDIVVVPNQDIKYGYTRKSFMSHGVIKGALYNKNGKDLTINIQAFFLNNCHPTGSYDVDALYFNVKNTDQNLSEYFRKNFLKKYIEKNKEEILENYPICEITVHPTNHYGNKDIMTTVALLRYLWESGYAEVTFETESVVENFLKLVESGTEDDLYLKLLYNMYKYDFNETSIINSNKIPKTLKEFLFYRKYIRFYRVNSFSHNSADLFKDKNCPVNYKTIKLLSFEDFKKLARYYANGYNSKYTKISEVGTKNSYFCYISHSDKNNVFYTDPTLFLEKSISKKDVVFDNVE